MLRKIAIVGANGFVGRHLVELAARHRIEVIGIVRSQAGAGLVREMGGQPALVNGLTADALEALVPRLAGCDGLVYTASVSNGLSGDKTDPSGLTSTIALCLSAGVPRFVFLSGLGTAHYGMNPHCTNSYFLSKLAGEVSLFRSTVKAVVLRPSYIFGTGDEFLTPLIRRMRSSEVIEIPGDGRYRMQPISVQDAASVILGSLASDAPGPAVVDLVGPEPISYRALIDRVATCMKRSIDVRERPIEEALVIARNGDYFGLRAHDLACLLCDEISDSGPARSLSGREFESLDAMIGAVVRETESEGNRP
jgi:nucleoside-diphosphate-sugar epimerase